MKYYALSKAEESMYVSSLNGGEDVEVKMGTHNNIIYAGTANAVSAMGIKF